VPKVDASELPGCEAKLEDEVSENGVMKSKRQLAAQSVRGVRNVVHICSDSSESEAHPAKESA
jgi:hypothetical protein